MDAISECNDISEKLWDAFQNSFKKAFEKWSPEELGRFWHTSSEERTSYYKHKIYPKLAELFSFHTDGRKVQVQSEFHTFDAVFRLKERALGEHPIVYIESENATKDSTHEISKFMWINAPLKVLITWAQWDSELYPDSHERKKKIKSSWQGTIELHRKALDSVGLVPVGRIGFLVGECSPTEDSTLRFYAFSYDEATRTWTDENILTIGSAYLPTAF